MKTLKIFLFIFIACISFQSIAGNDLPAYYKIATINEDISVVISKVKTTLTEANYKIIGEYAPGKSNHLYVFAFTSDEIQQLAIKKEDRGLLASVLKIGLYKSNNGVEVSMVNPKYLFNAYFMDEIENKKSQVDKIHNDLVAAVKNIGSTLIPFGGTVEDEDLWEYHYMLGMPYFTDPIKLKTFSSFEVGVKTIQQNLENKVGDTFKVYEVINSEKEVAVFGIGLLDKENGEAHFLPIIGEKHVAALPYEIILQGKTVTMLHGRYRIALHWPELTMTTFTKIMSTPGYVEDTFELVVD
jgi:hypothetical protein